MAVLFKVFALFFLIFSTHGFVDETHCEAYFSPKDHLAERLIQLIDKEQKSVQVAVYCLTHTGIANALVRARERGVDVEVIVDPFSIKSRAPLRKLDTAQVPLFVWEPKKLLSMGRYGERRPLMHDKFCLLGDHTLWTGSFNFTHDANTSHQENVLVVEDRDIVKKYREEFLSIKQLGCQSYREYLVTHPAKKRAKSVKKKSLSR
jgi:phosphatidylserine/phosphatidylglycerophosphate/cardiolipin synthase-like enzyme